ncbi:hypothetical protein D3C75_703150 [compost metagenome]
MAGDLEHHILADCQVLHEGSVYRRSRQELDIGTQIVSSGLAGLTVSARDPRFNRNPVADGHLGYLVSCGGDNSRTLMSENNRLLHNEAPDPSMLIIVQVRAAYANGHHLYEHFIRTHLGQR